MRDGFGGLLSSMDCSYCVGDDRPWSFGQFLQPQFGCSRRWQPDTHDMAFCRPE